MASKSSSEQSHVGGFHKPIHLKDNLFEMTLNVADPPK